MASMTLLQRIAIGTGVIAFATLGLFPPWDQADILALASLTQTDLTEWPTQTAGRHLIFSPPGGLDPRLAVDRLTVEWLIVAAITIGSVLILKQNQTNRT